MLIHFAFVLYVAVRPDLLPLDQFATVEYRGRPFPLTRNEFYLQSFLERYFFVAAAFAVLFDLPIRFLTKKHRR